MLQVAICDDNKVMLDFLKNEISRSLSAHSVQHKISTFTSGQSFMISHESGLFDVVFLDIKMPDVNGFEVAKRLRRLSEKTYIIFVTTESSLVYDSFDFRPFYFIPKSNINLLQEKLNNVIRKLILHMNENHPISIDLPYGEKKHVKPDSIIYISSKSNYLDITTSSEVIHIRAKLGDFLKLLPQNNFCRIHNRHIINLTHLCHIDNTRLKVILNNTIELDVSKTYKPSLIEKYNIFLRNHA